MGNPNKKSKLRKITVNGNKYFWNVSSPNCDGDYGCSFIIWKDRARIYSNVTHGEKITPKDVREKILSLNHAGSH